MIFFKGARVYPTMIVEIKDVQTDVMQPMAVTSRRDTHCLDNLFHSFTAPFFVKKNLLL